MHYSVRDRATLPRSLGPTEWKEEAACREMEPAIFFPVGVKDNSFAYETCATCPVHSECLDYALSVSSMVGIWAGTDENDRERMRRRRHRDRRRE